jgi:hypothetical protein
MRTGGSCRTVNRETSRFPIKELLRMPGSPTTPGRPGACSNAPFRIAFRQENGVGTRKEATFAAQWLACTYPCRRFADALAGNCARRGADADRYSFIARDLHPLLLAGLPALRNSFPQGLGSGHFLVPIAEGRGELLWPERRCVFPHPWVRTCARPDPRIAGAAPYSGQPRCSAAIR